MCTAKYNVIYSSFNHWLRYFLSNGLAFENRQIPQFDTSPLPLFQLFHRSSELFEVFKNNSLAKVPLVARIPIFPFWYLLPLALVAGSIPTNGI